MVASNLLQEMKKLTVFIELAVNHNDSVIASLLRVVKSFVLKMRNELEATDGNVSSVIKKIF